MIGKWHLGEGRDIDLPTNRGYDEFAGFLHGGRQSKEPEVDFLRDGPALLQLLCIDPLNLCKISSLTVNTSLTSE